MWPCRDVVDAVAQANLFADSKTFLDRPLKISRKSAVKAFHGLAKRAEGQIPFSVLQDFIEQNFGEAGSDLVKATPCDWENPTEEWLPLVRQGPHRDWAIMLNSLWPTFCRKVSKGVTEYPDRHTLIHLPFPMFVAGDRFREMYYWDSNWIVNGLLVCGMTISAELQVRNLLHLVKTYGYVPNGSRKYYLNRSQPPLLSSMVRCIWEQKRSIEFLEYAIPLLVNEHSYWTSSIHSVKVQGLSGKVYNLSRYMARWNSPRPESYREDIKTACDAEDHCRVYQDIASAAESGWDFSSRWLKNPIDLSSIQTSKMIPVDLNAFLYQTESNLSDFFLQIGDQKSAKLFKRKAARRQSAFDDIFWDASCKQWRDRILQDNFESVASPGVYASNWVPTWVGIEPKKSLESMSCEEAKAGVVMSLKSSGLILSGGVTTSLVQSGEQWDFPNAWAPCQAMIIYGMRKMGKSGLELAAELADKWLQTNFNEWNNGTGQMHEKYNAQSGCAGDGGEYEPQVGFGWTNGVALSLLADYGFKG